MSHKLADPIYRLFKMQIPCFAVWKNHFAGIVSELLLNIVSITMFFEHFAFERTPAISVYFEIIVRELQHCNKNSYAIHYLFIGISSV